MNNLRAHVFIDGFVQGVFFRQATAAVARSRGLGGWVRNLPDGRVEAVFEGAEEPVRGLVEWCRRGPPHATVERIDVRWEAATGEFATFETK